MLLFQPIMRTSTGSTPTLSAITSAVLSLCLLGIGASRTAHAAADDPASGFDLTLERANELQEAGSTDAALQIYRSLRDDRPTDPRLLHAMARASLSAGDYDACVSDARLSIASNPRDASAAYDVMARCQQGAGDRDAALKTLTAALQRFPQSAALHFNHALALRDRDRDAAAVAFAAALRLAPSDPALFLAYGALLDSEGQRAGALLMNLRYIMAAPHAPAATGAAEQILRLLDSETPAGAANGAEDRLQGALQVAREAATAVEGTASTSAGRLNRFLQAFVLGAVTVDDPAVHASPLWSSGVDPLLTMAEHDVLDTFLYFVGALARTEGSPEWLSAHRPQFERLVEYLAQPAT